MNDRTYSWILYLIIAVIMSTIGIQTYWNYQNYLNNKQQFINEMQLSLDNAVDAYYTNLAKKSTLGFTFDNNQLQDGSFDSILKQIDISFNKNVGLDTLKLHTIKGVRVFRGLSADSLMKSKSEMNQEVFSTMTDKGKSFKLSKYDSINNENINILTSKIVVSITRDSLPLPEIDSLIQQELARKNINVSYDLLFKSEDTMTSDSISRTQNTTLNASSKSSFLPKNSSLSIAYADETLLILKRSMTGIIISIVLVLAIISSLFYLLKIIKNQKQLAEVKNDLISNVTHEFKTPIATISVALESIKDFNVINDREKTKSYIDMSRTQLDKLNIMVEKLLETATLDSESLNLNKESHSISEMLQILVEKHQMQTQSKTLLFKDSTQPIFANVDGFHFENAINNVLDNAVKYGGNCIEIKLLNTLEGFEILISDNGKTLTKDHKDRIFEKFYRVPKGNTHDVKGFGIGLYYSKKIIEKHGGNIRLLLDDNGTTFQIKLPSE